jgi:hypothetical protein
MKGFDVPIADPIPPVTKFDDRPSVKDLIEENHHGINEVKHGLARDPLYDSAKHDDLWILRFLLSHKKKPKVAIEAAKTTLKFRKDFNLDNEDIRGYPMDGSCKSEAYVRYGRYCGKDAAKFVIPDHQRGVMGFIRLAAIDQDKLVKYVDKEDWLPAFCYMSEWTFQWLDYITRTTGRLTKSVRLIEMKGFQVSSVNKETLKRDGDAMGVMEDCYPQLLQTLFICHAPVWIQIAWRVVRPIMPRRVVQKMDFINPDTNEGERKRLLKYISEENLPERFGGKHEPWPVEFPLPPLNSHDGEVDNGR